MGEAEHLAQAAWVECGGGGLGVVLECHAQGGGLASTAGCGEDDEARWTAEQFPQLSDDVGLSPGSPGTVFQWRQRFRGRKLSAVTMAASDEAACWLLVKAYDEGAPFPYQPFAASQHVGVQATVRVQDDRVKRLPEQVVCFAADPGDVLECRDQVFRPHPCFFGSAEQGDQLPRPLHGATFRVAAAT